MMNPFGKLKRETLLPTCSPISLHWFHSYSQLQRIRLKMGYPIVRPHLFLVTALLTILLGIEPAKMWLFVFFIYLWHLTLKPWALDLAHEGSQRWRWDCWKTKQAVSINLEGEQTAHKESLHACAVFTRYSFIVKSQKMRLGFSSRQKMFSSRIILQEHCCCDEQTSRTDPAGPESVNTCLGVWFLLFIVGFH